MRKRGGQAGFNLVELMIALAILAIGMAAVGSMLFASYNSDRYNATLRRAETAGTKVIERFRAGNVGSGLASDACQRPLQLVPGPGGTKIGKAAYTMEPCIDETKPTGRFFLTWTSTDDPSGVKILEVVVAWDGPQCTYADPTKCLRHLRMSTIYQ
ncbi:MAG: prepilin-type N-terminal cleavage/methylation domain-containing protein [Desulfomonile tiedjei]|nr:prepilin-type N-terminal cleavage/methylation domain-containing protein [Desulfomonile tiedjei]